MPPRAAEQDTLPRVTGVLPKAERSVASGQLPAHWSLATGQYGEERAVTLRGGLNYYWEPRLAARTTADEAVNVQG